MKREKPQLVAIDGNEPEEESRVVRSELNLEQWSGIFAPSQSRGRRTEIRLLEQIQTLENGNTVKRTVSIEPSVKLGTLTAKDQRVLYALFLNWGEKGRPLSYCYYSTYRLAQLLKMNTSGASIESILDSLRRLNAVTLRFVECFINAETGEIYEDEKPIHILSDLNIKSRKRLEGGKYEPSKSEGYIEFHPRILKNLIRQYTRPLLFDVVLSLKSDIAQFIYSLADRQLATKGEYNITTTNLFDELNIEGKEYHKKSRRLRVLKAPLAELEGKPLSSGGALRIAERETKDGTDVVLIFSKSKKLLVLQPKTESKELDPPTSELVARMVAELGISQEVAQKLETTNPVGCFDWCEAKQQSRELRDKGAGFFVKAIVERWELPTDYKAKKGKSKATVETKKSKQREEARQAHWEKYRNAYHEFALAQLDAIKDAHPVAYDEFEKSAQQGLANHERLGLSDAKKTETLIFHAEWFFNDAAWQKFQVPFVSFWEWDAQHHPVSFQG